MASFVCVMRFLKPTLPFAQRHFWRHKPMRLNRVRRYPRRCNPQLATASTSSVDLRAMPASAARRRDEATRPPPQLSAPAPSSSTMACKSESMSRDLARGEGAFVSARAQGRGAAGVGARATAKQGKQHRTSPLLFIMFTRTSCKGDETIDGVNDDSERTRLRLRAWPGETPRGAGPAAQPPPARLLRAEQPLLRPSWPYEAGTSPVR
jgi:hypothetical protein